LIIDIVLVIIIAIIALVASRFIPNEEAIKSNKTETYKSNVKLIYGAGVGSIIVGVLLLVFYAIEKDYQLLINLGKIVVLMVIGIGLINKNFKISKTVSAFEGTVPIASAPAMGTVEAGVVTPTNVVGVTPAVQTQAQVTTVQSVQAQPQTVVQPQVAAQQIGIKGGGAVPAQTQMVAAQPQPAPQPKIIVIKCPKCQGAMQINTALLGQKMKCPHCGIEGRIG
jgi:hypothetical protein